MTGSGNFAHCSVQVYGSAFLVLQSDSTNEHLGFPPPLLLLPLTGIKAETRITQNKGAVRFCLPQFLFTTGLASTTHCVSVLALLILAKLEC